jgi:multidrug efflux system outer membrane protein
VISIGSVGFSPGDVVTIVVASLSALVAYPLYDGGARQAELTATEERLLQSVLLYRETVLDAIEEVESALLAYEGTGARLRALRTAVDRNRAAYEQSEQLYRDGFASFIDVLDSQRELNSSLQELAVAEQNLSLAVVDLYSALGGSPVAT